MILSRSRLVPAVRKVMPSTYNQGQVRVIAGRWRSRKIAVPDLKGLRPTSDRTRETLFNWLAPIIQEAHCLDLFAGSGILGFEALSRGASHVTFVDNEAVVIKHLQQTLIQLEAEAEILQLNATKEFISDGKPFDIVFLDPPFNQNLLEPTCSWLEQSDLLAQSTYIYIEAERGLTQLPTPENWHTIRKKVIGQVSYYLVWREA